MWQIIACTFYILVQKTIGVTDVCAQYGVTGLTHGTECFVQGEGASTWADAQSRCIAIGGALAAVPNVSRHQFLVDEMGKRGWTTVWTGAKRKLIPWSWSAEGSLNEMNDQGCYKDNESARDLPREVNIDEWRNSPENIPVECQKICKNEGFTYAGVQYTQKQQKLNCYCGVQFGRYGQSTDCDVTCEMMCGGDDKNQIYLVTLSVPSDLGCYSDNSSARDLTEQMNIDSVRSTPDRIPGECQQQCRNRGYAYAGVQYSTNEGRFNCFCGNSYGKYGQTTGCDRTCDNVTSNVNCGGVDINHIFKIDGGFSHWGPNQPNGEPEHHYCALLDQRMDFNMLDYDCTHRTKFICSFPSSNCPSDPQGHNKHLFLSNVTGQCIFLSTEYKTWDKSWSDCQGRAQGGSLLAIANKNLHKEIKKMALDIANEQSAVDEQYWVASTSDKWAWPDGSIIIYNNWRANFPDRSASSGGDCVALDNDNGIYTWINANCNTTSQYFCQMGVTVATDPPVTWPSTTAQSTVSTQAQLTTTTELVITGSAGPGTGASTGESGGLTTFQIVLIFVLVFLLVAVIVAVGVFIYYKKKHSKKQVAPSKYDTGENGLPPSQESPSANGLAFKDSSAFSNGHANGSAGINKDKWHSKRIYIEN